MRERPTARVLLLDPMSRILLMKGRLPSAPYGPGGWFTVGGGIEDGESLEAAARREILEETGFTDARVGPVQWTSEAVHADRKGRPVLIRSWFLIAWCAGGEPSRAGWQPLEREFVDDIRWWTLADLVATADAVFPPDLAERLTGILGR